MFLFFFLIDVHVQKKKRKRKDLCKIIYHHMALIIHLRRVMEVCKSGLQRTQAKAGLDLRPGVNFHCISRYFLGGMIDLSSR